MFNLKNFDGVYKNRIFFKFFYSIKKVNFSNKSREVIDITSFSSSDDLIQEFEKKFPIKFNKKKTPPPPPKKKKEGSIYWYNGFSCKLNS